MSKLNDKRKRFCKEYAAKPNATNAAIKAGYSKKTAYSIGQRLLKKVEIKNELERLTKKVTDKLEVTREKIIREWAILAFSNIADVVNVKNNSVVIKDFATLDEEIQRSIQSVSEGKFGLSLKLHDKKAGLEALSKIQRLWVDRSENTTVTYDLAKLPPEYLKRIAAGEDYIKVIAEYEYSIQPK